MFGEILDEKEQEELLGKKPIPKLYYKFKDYPYNTKSRERVLSNITHLDYLTKGFELGCVTIWTGGTNAGKTTLMTMITKETILQGEKVFYFNGEQTKDDFKNNLYKQSVSKDKIFSKQYKQSNVFDQFVSRMEVDKLDRLYGDNLIVFNNDIKRSITNLLKAMEDVKEKYGVRVFMLDNFMQIETETSDEYREQKDIMEKLRTFAVNKEVHIHLIVHQKKTDKNNPRITIYDVFGSSNLVNKAYNVISIVRVDNLDKEGNEYKRLSKVMLEAHYDISKTSTILEVLKTKGVACGVVGLIYEPITKTYTQQPKLTSEMYDKLIRTNKSMGSDGNCPF